MAARKKSASKKKPAKKKASAGVGIVNKNQRRQLEALGYVSPPKRRR